MIKNSSKRLFILIVSVSLTLAFLTKPSMSYQGKLFQPNDSLTPYAFLPIIYKSDPNLFVKTEASPFYLQNFTNNAGCDWLGIAGEVLDLNRNPVPAGSYKVHVWGSGIDQRLIVGSAPAYSPSGWEQFLFDSPIVRDYQLQLEAVNGMAVSPIYDVQTRASCNENLVRFDFVQNY